MTVNELLDAFKRLNCDGSEEVVVHAFGGFRVGKSIKAVSQGFDWDMGKIILHPSVPLTTKGEEK